LARDAHKVKGDGLPFKSGKDNPAWKGGIPGPNKDGYLRFTHGALRHKYAHRAYADRQMLEKYGRPLRANEEVHHLCGNRACWPPTDFHLVIMDEAIHHAIDAGKAPHWKRKKGKHA
jgi:hypothetical protein